VKSSELVDEWFSGLGLVLVRVSRSLPSIRGTNHQSSAFSPTLFSGGEGGRRPDEGACDECDFGPCDALSNGEFVPPNAPLIRLRHLLPPQKARGEKALDWRAAQGGLSERVRALRFASTCQSPNELSLPTPQSSPFSPTLFSGGEGGRRPDEGAFDWRGSQDKSAACFRTASLISASLITDHPGGLP